MIKFILKDGGTYFITAQQIENWQRLYRNINVLFLVEIMAAKSIEDKSVRKTSFGINRYINKELARLNASK